MTPIRCAPTSTLTLAMRVRAPCDTWTMPSPASRWTAPRTVSRLTISIVASSRSLGSSSPTCRIPDAIREMILSRIISFAVCLWIASWSGERGIAICFTDNWTVKVVQLAHSHVDVNVLLLAARRTRRVCPVVHNARLARREIGFVSLAVTNSPAA